MEHTSQSSTVQQRRQDKPWLRPLRTVAYIIALTSFAGIASVSLLEIVAHNEHQDIVQITVPNPGIRTAIAIYAIIGALTLLRASIVFTIRRRIALGAISMLIALAGLGGFAVLMLSLSRWTTEAEILGPDGHTYYFMDSSIMQGSSMTIARLKSNNLLTRTMEVQGVPIGCRGSNWVPVIRPAGAPEDDYAQLYVTDANMILGIQRDHECYLAYDTTSNRFYGPGLMEKVSPFVLIGPNTPMRKSDVEVVIACVEWRIEFLSGINDIDRLARRLSGAAPFGHPTSETLRANLAHPNSAVGEVCKRILRIHENAAKMLGGRVSKHIEKMIEQLKSEDVDARKRAAIALRNMGPPAKVAIPALTEAMKDGNSSVRRAAKQAVEQITK